MNAVGWVFIFGKYKRLVLGLLDPEGLLGFGLPPDNPAEIWIPCCETNCDFVFISEIQLSVSRLV